MQPQHNQIKFFISQLLIDEDPINEDPIDEDQELLFSKICDFFEDGQADKHLIFKRSILYFYAGSDIIDTHACVATKSKHSITFDGTKVAKIDKNYFVGAASSSVFDVEFEIANNNNNNNNNGNNNG